DGAPQWRARLCQPRRRALLRTAADGSPALGLDGPGASRRPRPRRRTLGRIARDGDVVSRRVPPPAARRALLLASRARGGAAQRGGQHRRLARRQRAHRRADAQPRAALNLETTKGPPRNAMAPLRSARRAAQLQFWIFTLSMNRLRSWP